MTLNENDVPVRPGDLLAGKYRIERVLGAGGMGVVVSAVQVELDRRVAVKIVANGAVSDVARQRFLREARAAAKLRSEHVARVLDVGADGTTPFIVMEHLEGKDLQRILAARGALPVELAVDCVAQACEAVAEAHALGIVHRDLKPQNLFLTRRLDGAPHVKVLDFGVSKITDRVAGALTQTSVVLGSPMYMSPEQMRSSRRADARSDVWSLGVVLFELLTRETPFAGETAAELALAVTNEAPARIGQYRGDVPPGLVAIVDRCLEKDPAKRYRNAGELGAALEAFASAAGRGSAATARRLAARLDVTLGGGDRSPVPGPASAPVARSPVASGARPSRRLAPFVASAAVAAFALAFLAFARRGSDVRVVVDAVAIASEEPASVPPPLVVPPIASSAPPVSPVAPAPPAALAVSVASRAPVAPHVVPSRRGRDKPAPLDEIPSVR